MDKVLKGFVIFGIGAILVITLYSGLYLPYEKEEYRNSIENLSCQELDVLKKEASQYFNDYAHPQANENILNDEFILDGCAGIGVKTNASIVNDLINRIFVETLFVLLAGMIGSLIVYKVEKLE